MGRRFAPEEMRDAPVLGHRPLRKEVVFPGAFSPTSFLLEELEGILTYVECVTSSLLHRARTPMPPESIRAVPIASVSSRQMSSGGPCEASPLSSLAIALHDSANSLLIWFAKLEYVSLSRGMTLADVDRGVGEAAAAVLAALDAVELRYGGHAVTDAREFFAGSRQTVDDCRRAVRAVGAAAAGVLALRRLVAAGDVPRATALLAEHRPQYNNSNKEELINTKNNNKNGDAYNTLLRPHSPFLTWVEKRWLPAMVAWRALLDEAQKKAIKDADVAPALEWARQQALEQSTLISEILQPGETLSELLREKLEEPLAQLAETIKSRRECIDALRTAIATPELKTIVECVCAVEKLATAGELTVAGDRELLKQGKRVIIRLQQVENVESSLQLATRTGGIATLFRAIHQANDILFQLEIAGDLVATKEVVSRCSTILNELKGTKVISPSDYIVKHVDTNTIHVVHVPSQIWTTKTTAAYQNACKLFTSRVLQERVRLELERVLDVDDQGLLNRTCSSVADDMSNSSSNNHTMQFARTLSQFPSFGAARVQELRTTLNRAKEVGLKGKVVQDGEACLRSVEAMKLKIHFEAQLRILRVTEPDRLTFEEIYEKVYKFCMQQKAVLPRPEGRRLRICYRDRDGDCISLLTQDDWNTFLLEEAPGGLIGARLELFCDFPPLPHASLLDTPPHSATSASVNGMTAAAAAAAAATTKTATGRGGMEQEEKSTTNATTTTTTTSTTRPKVAVSTALLPGTRSGVVLKSSLLEPLRKNVGPAMDTDNTRKFIRSQSAGFALRQAGLLPRHVTPKRTAFDDSCVKSLDSHLLAEEEPTAHAKMATDLAVPSTVRVSHKTTEKPLPSTTPGRSGRLRVKSVKLDSQPTTKTTKMVPSTREEKKKRPTPKLIDSTQPQTLTTPTPTPSASSTTNSTSVSAPVTTPVAAAAVPRKAAAVRPTVTSVTSSNHNDRGTADATPVNPAKSGDSTTDAKTPPVTAVQLEKTRSWKEDEDLNFDLQTVVSTASIVSRPVVTLKNNNGSSNSKNIDKNKTTTAIVTQKKLETPSKTSVPKRSGNGFTVTPCGKSTGSGAKVTQAENTTGNNLADVKGGTTVVEAKREWSADMFMLSDICTVVSEQTTPPASVKNRGTKKKQTTPTTEEGSPGVTATTPTPSTPSSTNNPTSKKKAEVLLQLRQLREENQKALKAAIQQRRTGK
ncbi:PB1 domain [Trypanosoma melophagium]|uniref:PB1 domain n=1 Tax=Trypanosoma melophagium TaxID=715481 RepID=UPI003519DC46|nr:PB1 domain [Trypanosoma melophagium]